MDLFFVTKVLEIKKVVEVEVDLTIGGFTLKTKVYLGFCQNQGVRTRHFKCT